MAKLREARDPAQLQLRADLWGAASRDPVLRRRLKTVTARQRALLRNRVTESIERKALELDPRLTNAFASVLLALCEGLTLHRGIDPRAFRWKNIRALLQDLSG